MTHVRKDILVRANARIQSHAWSANIKIPLVALHARIVQVVSITSKKLPPLVCLVHRGTLASLRPRRPFYATKVISVHQRLPAAAPHVAVGPMPIQRGPPCAPAAWLVMHVPRKPPVSMLIFLVRTFFIYFILHVVNINI